MITEVALAGVIAVALAAQEEKKPADEVYRVGGDVTAPKLLTRVEPRYPQGAREERIEGVVILEAVITASGNVADVKVLKFVHPLVDAAAAHAVRQWIYRPATLNGEAVAVYLTVTVTFNLGVRPPNPRPRDSLIGTWQVPGQRAWVQIDKRARAYACRITNTDVISKASGVIRRTPEGTVIDWEGNWSPEVVSRDGDELLLIRPGTGLRFRPYDGKLAKSCAQE
jgi:TonB family protein